VSTQPPHLKLHHSLSKMVSRRRLAGNDPIQGHIHAPVTVDRYDPVTVDRYAPVNVDRYAFGWSRPVKGRMICWLELVAPAGSMKTSLVYVLVAYTSPAVSTATPTGWTGPVNGTVVCWLELVAPGRQLQDLVTGGVGDIDIPVHVDGKGDTATVPRKSEGSPAGRAPLVDDGSGRPACRQGAGQPRVWSCSARMACCRA
jgi:hypothetical protein